MQTIEDLSRVCGEGGEDFRAGASDAHEADARQYRQGEEQGMAVERFPLAEVRSAVLSGRVRNATLAVAVLAACASREEGWSSLRPA